MIDRQKYLAMIGTTTEIYMCIKHKPRHGEVFFILIRENLQGIYQRSPVCVQISNFQRWHKLGTGHHQEIEIKEELELLVENLREGEREDKHWER